MQVDLPIEGEWVAIPKMLDLFQRYKIRATWATVGILMCRDYSQWREIRPSELPSYIRSQCSTYLLNSVIVRDSLPSVVFKWDSFFSELGILR